MRLLIPVRYANRSGSVMITENQYNCILKRNYINSGLDLDTYMSIIDPNWPL